MDPIKWNDKTMCVRYDEKKETIHYGSDVKLKHHTQNTYKLMAIKWEAPAFHSVGEFNVSFDWLRESNACARAHAHRPQMNGKSTQIDKHLTHIANLSVSLFVALTSLVVAVFLFIYFCFFLSLFNFIIIVDIFILS